MEFPQSYFEEEVREGFYISGMMKRSWAAQLEVLSEIDKVCERHNIRWFADCGTLLGAVRHGGFIPWDDDLDICMLREDYDLFCKYSHELPDGYRYEDRSCFFNVITTVLNGDTFNFDKNFLEKHHQFPFVAGIDIMPLDYISRDTKKQDEQRQLIDRITKMMVAVSEERVSNEEVRLLIDEVQNITGKCIDKTLPIIDLLYDCMIRIFELYGAKDSDCAVLMPYWAKDGSHVYPLNYYDRLIDLPFERGIIKAPEQYDRILQIEYGDYMHTVKGMCEQAYPLYERQENELINKLGRYPFLYTFSKDDIVDNTRTGRIKPAEQIHDFVNDMRDMLDEVLDSLQKGDTRIFSVLEACQSKAIAVGTMLEKKYGEDFEAVHNLEEYCEIIYQIYQLADDALGNGISFDTESLDSICQSVGSVLDKILSCEHANINEKRELVIIPYRVRYWDTLESIWRKAKALDDTDVKVIPIPYYDRNADGTFNEMHYEGNMYPSYVEITDYRSYDFEAVHPDEIIMQNPYDECNYTTCFDEYYFSNRLRKYTDKLVYIPYFTMDDFSLEQVKYYQTMKYFCMAPGVVRADIVVVQSETMRKNYIEYLTRACGEDTRHIWENKIIDRNSSEYYCEAKLSSKERSVEAVEDKKRLLYTVTVAGISQNPDKIFDKMQRSFMTFTENKDKLYVVWYADSLIEAAFKESRPELWEKYNDMVKLFLQCDIGEYATELPLEGLISSCTAFYGDKGVVAHRCTENGMPVMLQNVDV